MEIEKRHAVYIHSPVWDGLFIFLAPLWALLLGAFFSKTSLASYKYQLYGRPESALSLFSGAFTMGHLFIVIFRSYLNPGIFKLHRRRFIVAPLILFSAMMISSWVLVFVFVLCVFWDVYHSSLQTFGFGRIYDAKAGNDTEKGRRLDYVLNLLIYAGPVLGGVCFVDHIVHFEKFKDVGSLFLSAVPAHAQGFPRLASIGLWSFAAIFIPFYVWRYWRWSREGYRIPAAKVMLLVSTGLCSIWAWGFNAFGQAFFIMNFFHALQYFALVWKAEQNRIGPWIFAITLVVVGFGYGIWAKFWGESTHLAFSLLLTVSVMHFWYDGFIWSVRRKEV